LVALRHGRQGLPISLLPHSDFASILKNSARLDNWGDLAEWFQVPFFPGGQVEKSALLNVDFQFVSSTYPLAEAFRRLKGNHITTVDRVAEENASVEFGDDRFDAGSVESDGGMFAGRPAAEIPAGNNDFVRRNELVFRVERHMSLGQAGLSRRNAAQSIFAEHPVLIGNGRIKGKVLSRDDLIRIDVIAEDVTIAGDGALHGILRENKIEATRYDNWWVFGLSIPKRLPSARSMPPHNMQH